MSGTEAPPVPNQPQQDVLRYLEEDVLFLLTKTISSLKKKPILLPLQTEEPTPATAVPTCPICSSKYTKKGAANRYPMMLHESHFACKKCVDEYPNFCPTCRRPVTKTTMRPSTVKEVIEAKKIQLIAIARGDINPKDFIRPENVVVNLCLFDPKSQFNQTYVDPSAMVRAGKVYYPPVGWRRVCVLLPDLETKFPWCVAYLGTTGPPEKVLELLQGGLISPNRVVEDLAPAPSAAAAPSASTPVPVIGLSGSPPGNLRGRRYGQLGVSEGRAIPTRTVTVTPSIEYAALNSNPIVMPGGRMAQLVLELRVKPGSFETRPLSHVGWPANTAIDEYFSNDSLEWHCHNAKNNAVITGLMIRIVSDTDPIFVGVCSATGKNVPPTGFSWQRLTRAGQWESYAPGFQRLFEATHQTCAKTTVMHEGDRVFKIDLNPPVMRQIHEASGETLKIQRVARV